MALKKHKILRSGSKATKKKYTKKICMTQNHDAVIIT